MSPPRRALGFGLTLLAVACGTSGDGLIQPPPPPVSPVVTGAGPFLVSNANPGVGAGLLDPAGGGLDGRAWVALRPGTLGDSVSGVTLRVLRTGAVVAATLIDGGLDPVAIAAVKGDTVVLTLNGLSGPPQAALVFEVPERKPPVIVRTVPPRGTRDVPLNTRMQVVFSEPIATSVLSDGEIAVRAAGATIPGQLHFADTAHTVVEFVPDEDLPVGTRLELVVGPGVADLDGSVLGAAEVVEFSTVGGPPPPAGEREIAFVRDGQILLATPAGIQVLTATPPGTANWGPAWSPDGSRLAFVSDRDGPQAIYLMDADGSNPVRISDGPWDDSPVWTPDGTGIVFSGLRNGSNAIMRTRIDGGASPPEFLLLNSPGWNAYPAISPDGRTLIFTTDWRAFDFLGDLFAITIGDPTSFHPVLLGPFAAGDRHYYIESVWSPDGQRVAFSDCLDAFLGICAGEGTLATVRPDGSGYEALALTSGAASPSWSPTGSHLAYTMWNCLGTAPCIRLVPAVGGQWEEVLDDAQDPAWRP